MDRKEFFKRARSTARAKSRNRGTMFAGLAPYAGSWTSNEVMHLLKRTMFGAKKADIDYFLALSPDAAVDEFIEGLVERLEIQLLLGHQAGKVIQPDSGAEKAGRLLDVQPAAGHGQDFFLHFRTKFWMMYLHGWDYIAVLSRFVPCAGVSTLLPLKL